MMIMAADAGPPASTGTAGAGVWLPLVVPVLCVVFHRLRDRTVFAGQARTVFARPLARSYLGAVAIFWVLQVAGTGYLVATDQASAALPDWAALVLLPLIIAVTAVNWVVHRRAQAASAKLAGPLAQLGQFIRISYGTAAPAAVRRLRAGD